jgi:hypothetical protein
MTSSGWGTLRGIVEEARSLQAEEDARERDPVDCPHCGTPLRDGGPDGTTRYCPFDGWRPR